MVRCGFSREGNEILKKGGGRQLAPEACGAARDEPEPT
jgi:hypothetical protein